MLSQDKEKNGSTRGYGAIETQRVVNRKYFVWMIFLACILLGPLNFVLYKVMYTSFDDHEAFFVAQLVNLQYVVIGGIALKYLECKGEITEKMYQVPHLKFIIMGSLDCIAGMLAGLSSKRTPGSVQQLLNQSLIPCTMFASYIFLGQVSSIRQILGSLIIFVGAWIVIMPSIVDYGAGSISSLSLFIYFSSNIPYAASYVYKEHAFKNLAINVIYLTQWVSIYQLLIGFLVAPIQFIPGMGSETGLTFNGILESFYSGFTCYLEYSTACMHRHTFLLCTAYCCINFMFNTMGLFLVKYGSATMNAISYAIILPLTTLAFTSPMLGIYQEKYQESTLFGLVVVLLGFFLWKYEDFYQRSPGHANAANTVIEAREYSKLAGTELDSGPLVPSDGRADAFHERVIVPLMP